MYGEIQKLVEGGKFLGGFLVDKPIEPVLKMNAPEIKGFPSLQKPLEQVLELLRNDKLKGIGIWGTLGVGKTTIMQNLNNNDEIAKMFDIVIWANVSGESSEEKLQEDIARRLKLKMEGIVHPEEISRTISEELNNKKFLLLLDEVMDSIELEDIGIPDNKNGSKVVLTTEFRHVCSLMADRLIEVRPLLPNEAWKIFQQMVIDVVDLPDIEPVAQLVAKECARLPLLIKTVAGAFKLKDSVSEWRKGLKDLRKWPEIEIPGLTDLHSFLKFCYDQLKDDQKRKCFLYGALYPAESKIYTDYLLECWAAEGLVGNTNEKRRFKMPVMKELSPQVGELHCLEVLDIRGCRIRFLPFHIKKLVNLRCLRVSYYKSSNPNDCQDMDIDCKVIPLLAKLEELVIDVDSYDHWCNEHSPSWKDRQQLTSFRFFVGCQNRKRPQNFEYFKYKINRYLVYCHGNHNDYSIICDLLPETDALELVEHKDITSLMDFVNVASFNRVRGCVIERCNKMTTIADGNRTEGGLILPNLEQLHLVNLWSLQTIFEGSLSTKSLSKLHTVVVTSCPILRKIFSLKVIQQLSKLQKLAIQNCAEIKELIEKADSAGQVSPAFPNLEPLILIEMPKLRTISADKSLTLPSLKELQVYRCPELKSLPFDKDNAANLKSIETEQVWWEALRWPQNDVKEQLQSICNLS
ncbi:hypothetical protein CRYUN_Cryun13aG0025400 [Craigia yunnanensis]